MRWVVVLMLLLAGCLGGAPPEGPQAEVPPTDAPEVTPTDAPEVIPTEAPSVGTLPTADLTAMTWEILPNLTRVIQISAAFASETYCDHEYAATIPGGETRGVVSMVLTENAPGLGPRFGTGMPLYTWATSGSSPIVTAHVDDMGTPPTQTSGGVGRAGFGSYMNGTVRWTLFADQLTPSAGSSWLEDGKAFVYTVKCDGAFDLVGASESDHYVLEAGHGLSRGVSASATALDLSHGAGVELTTTFDTSAACGTITAFGSHAVRVHGAGPQGESEWRFLPDPDSLNYGFGRVDGPAGDYRIDVTRAAAGSDPFWCAIWELARPANLAQRLA